MKRPAQQAVALVVTLVLLAVITVVTVAFLGIVSRNQASVAQSSSLTDAEFMADTARERAVSEMAAQILARSNLLAYDLAVSRNTDKDISSPAAIASLRLDPRVPVSVSNAARGFQDFTYLDLNRNRVFDTNDALADPVGDPEWVGLLEKLGQPHSERNRFIGRYAFIVLPVGKSLDANFLHNQAKGLLNMNALDNGFMRNQGFGSWEINLAAFLTDLNTNYWTDYKYAPVLNLPSASGRGFDDARELLSFRYTSNSFPAAGPPLSPHTYLDTVSSLFGQAGAFAFTNDLIDGYANGVLPLLASSVPPAEDVMSDDPTKPWPGADNKRRFFSLHDYFGVPQSVQYADFINRLHAASSRTNNSAYDRHTFYRLLSQLGTDSVPEPEQAEPARLVRKLVAQRPAEFPTEPVGRFNLNYDNLGQSATNFLPWTNALKFFTNVADTLLRGQFPVTNASAELINITNIQLYPSNYYSAAVHRQLQVAANILDATYGSRHGETAPFYPSVFRPVFTNIDGFIYINGYKEVSDLWFRTNFWRDLNNPADRAALSANDNVHGVPFVLGARKGFPNFNELSLQTAVQTTRKLKLTRPNTATNTVADNTDVMTIMGISNVVSVESWNSYSEPYRRDLRIEITNLVTFSLTASYITQVFATNVVFTNSSALTVPSNTWRGYEYKVPLNASLLCLPDMVWGGGLAVPRFVGLGATNLFERAFLDWQWRLTVSNRLVYIVTDGLRVVDFVNLNDLTAELNLNEIMGTPRAAPAGGSGQVLFANQWQDNARFFEPELFSSFWRTNRAPNVPAYVGPQGDVSEGVIQQLQVSLGNVGITNLADWNNWSGRSDSLSEKDAAIDGARKFVGLGQSTTYYTSNTWTAGLEILAPFNPTRKVFHYTSWQVNDPLVHYTTADLVQYTNALLRVTDQAMPRLTEYVWPKTWPSTNGFLNSLNERYRPWGPNLINSNLDGNTYNLAVKDPLIRRSDDWEFPTSKFPNIGWLGRVHRGTPWQTIYLKAEPTTTANWFLWAGSPILPWQATGFTNQWDFTQPTNDWRLVDLFTVAQSPNASRGLLSINQSGLAAWSAVLGGVSVFTNHVPDGVIAFTNNPSPSEMLIEPNTPQLSNIVFAINRHRFTRTNQSQIFTRLSDLLAVPELSVSRVAIPTVPAGASPFLRFVKPNDPLADPQQTHGLPDYAYERIPQQVLSLLKVGEARFVIYGFGQSLKPAPNSILTSGSVGLCTNYQVTGEVATRAVVRFDNVSVTNVLGISTQLLLRPVIESFNLMPPE